MSTPLADSPNHQLANSHDLPPELGLSDLVLTQILFIVGLPWVGVAAKLGPAHIVFWLIAMALFYVPSAIGVLLLHRPRRPELDGALRGSGGHRRHSPQAADAARRRAVSVGEARVQRGRGVPGRLE